MDGNLISKKEATRNRILWLSVISNAIGEAYSTGNIISTGEDKTRLQREAREWLLYDIEFYDVCDLAGLSKEQALSLREKMEKKYGER